MSKDNKPEYSPSGNPVYRHQPRQNPFEPVKGEDELARRKLEAHIEQYIGKIDRVFHEIISDLVHIDLFIIAPTPHKQYYTLVTAGMSDLPMNVPPGFEEYRYAELILSLPYYWPLAENDLKDEQNYWPLRWLKVLARLPHEYRTWLGWGHTIPNGDPALPFASNTRLCCQLVLLPVLTSPEFARLQINPQKTIQFWSVVPLYAEEMEHKLRYGTESLIENLNKAGVTELLVPNRPNTSF